MVESIKELRLICEKDTRADRPVSEVLPRFFAIYITWVLLHTKISANQVTLLGFSFGVAAGILFILGTGWYPILGAIFLLVNFQLDYVDGEIARYRKSGSLTGRYISTLFGHHLLETWVFISLTFGAYNVLGDVRVFIFGFAAALSALMIRLAVFNTYSGVIEAGLKITANGGKPKQIEETQDQETKVSPDSYVMSFMSSFGPFVYKVFENLLSPGRELMILTAAILDFVIVPIALWEGAQMTFLSVVLIFWAVISVLAWLALATIAIKKRTSETLFERLFSGYEKN